MVWTPKAVRAFLNVGVLLAVTGLIGCASTPPAIYPSKTETAGAAITPPHPETPSHRALAVAINMIGTPYRYGGASPRGFDCSGLVYYAYRKAGIHTPRTAKQQYRHARRIKVSQLQPGDLIFFSISRKRLSHVGIYAGDGRFVHAPSSGKSVKYASLRNPYWRTRVTAAGRLP